MHLGLGRIRTLVISLGSWSNAIIRHPLRAADFVPDVRAEMKFFFARDDFSAGETGQDREAVFRGQATRLQECIQHCRTGLAREDAVSDCQCMVILDVVVTRSALML
jgi:hypothetical protein